MSSLFGGALNPGNFNQPTSDDDVSAPPEPQAPTVPAGQFAGSELAQFLKNAKKQKKFSLNPRLLRAERRARKGGGPVS